MGIADGHREQEQANCPPVQLSYYAVGAHLFEIIDADGSGTLQAGVWVSSLFSEHTWPHDWTMQGNYDWCGFLS